MLEDNNSVALQAPLINGYFVYAYTHIHSHMPSLTPTHIHT